MVLRHRGTLYTHNIAAYGPKFLFQLLCFVKYDYTFVPSACATLSCLVLSKYVSHCSVMDIDLFEIAFKIYVGSCNYLHNFASPFVLILSFFTAFFLL
jgi:hypothetical protein